LIVSPDGSDSEAHSTLGSFLTSYQSPGCHIDLNPYHACLKWLSWTIFDDLVLFDGAGLDKVSLSMPAYPDCASPGKVASGGKEPDFHRGGQVCAAKKNGRERTLRRGPATTYHRR
jgi:hypothetical protein